jgi:hypothetical protein
MRNPEGCFLAAVGKGNSGTLGVGTNARQVLVVVGEMRLRGFRCTPFLREAMRVVIAILRARGEPFVGGC